MRGHEGALPAVEAMSAEAAGCGASGRGRPLANKLAISGGEMRSPQVRVTLAAKSCLRLERETAKLIAWPFR